MENKVIGGLSMPGTGGQLFGGPIPSGDGQAIVDARMARIAELEAANAALVSKAKQQSDYTVQLGEKLRDTQIALGQAQAENERLKAELASK